MKCEKKCVAKRNHPVSQDTMFKCLSLAFEDMAKELDNG